MANIPRQQRFEFEIPFVSQDFPQFWLGVPVNGNGTLQSNWNDLLWAALTVGRPNRNSLFHDGEHSYFEALFRMSITRMALRTTVPQSSDRKLYFTEAFRTLDPSEKGAINYFLGMTICKLFAYEYLTTPWLLHLDVFGAQLAAVLSEPRRPDLVAQRCDGEWIAFECKGRSAFPGRRTRDSAKIQAQRLVSIGGRAPVLSIAAVTFFRQESLRFNWRDPEPAPGKPNSIGNLRKPKELWRYYYEPTLNYVRAQSGEIGTAAPYREVRVALHPVIEQMIDDGLYERAPQVCSEYESVFLNDGFYPDGISVSIDQSAL